MEDLEEEPIPDIDSCDAKNPLAVVEYVEDIYNFYRQTEVNFDPFWIPIMILDGLITSISKFSCLFYV